MFRANRIHPHQEASVAVALHSRVPESSPVSVCGTPASPMDTFVHLATFARNLRCAYRIRMSARAKLVQIQSLAFPFHADALPGQSIEQPVQSIRERQNTSEERGTAVSNPHKPATACSERNRSDRRHPSAVPTTPPNRRSRLRRSIQRRAQHRATRANRNQSRYPAVGAQSSVGLPKAGASDGC